MHRGFWHGRWFVKTQTKYDCGLLHISPTARKMPATAGLPHWDGILSRKQISDAPLERLAFNDPTNYLPCMIGIQVSSAPPGACTQCTTSGIKRAARRVTRETWPTPQHYICFDHCLVLCCCQAMRPNFLGMAHVLPGEEKHLRITLRGPATRPDARNSATYGNDNTRMSFFGSAGRVAGPRTKLVEHYY